MKATLHLNSESTSIEIDLPEAQPLSKMRARVNIYSNISHTLWTATLGNVVAEVVSTTPDPRATLAQLVANLRNETMRAAAQSTHH